MRVRPLLTTLALAALAVTLLLGAATQISLADTAHVDVAPMVLESVAGELAGDECTAPAEAAPAGEALDAGAAYECPHGLPYCWNASQCVDFCGAGFEACVRGCCACTG